MLPWQQLNLILQPAVGLRSIFALDFSLHSGHLVMDPCLLPLFKVVIYYRNVDIMKTEEVDVI